jgi:hypothetical protein
VIALTYLDALLGEICSLCGIARKGRDISCCDAFQEMLQRVSSDIPACARYQNLALDELL